MSNTLKCSKCGIVKDVSEFSKRPSRKRGYQYACKECMRGYRESRKEEVKEYNSKYYGSNKDRLNSYMKFWKYGITPQQFNLLFESQGGCCAICGRHQSEFKQSLCIDHCHITGTIRGLLCTDCNRGIGGLQDKPNVCLKAHKYLSAFEQ